MQERLGKLGVSKKAINVSIRHSDPFENDIPFFIRGVSRKISKEQPELYKYLRVWAQNSGGDLLAYSLGTSLTYDLLPESHTKEPLTIEEISTMHQNLVEHATYEEDEQKKPVIDLSWFIDKLEADSPIFKNWLVESIRTIEGMEGKKSFLMGVTHVAMPFYMREEAKEMEQTLFRDEGERK